MRLESLPRSWGFLGAGVLILVVALLLGEALPFPPGSPYSDAATSHYGAALQLRRSVLEQGEFPLWQQTILIGQPFAANPLNKTAYPLQLLALLFAPAQHLNVMIGLHIALAGWGMWRWARVQGLGREAAALSAVAYALAPRLLAHTGAGHLDILYALAWWPHLMTAVERMGKPDVRGVQAALEMALTAALVLTADVRTALFALLLAGAVLLWRLGQGCALLVRRVVPRLGMAGGVGALLVAALLVPLLAWMPSLTRSGLTVGEAGTFSMMPLNLIGLLMPANRFGFEFLTYGGLLVLVLALVALIMQPRRLGFWGGACLIAAAYALGVNGLLWQALVRALPPLLWFRVPARAWLVVALLLPLLAGHGMHLLLTMTGQRQQRAIACLGILALLVVTLSSGLMFLSPGGLNARIIVISGLTLAVVFVSTRRNIRRRVLFATALIAVVALDLAGLGAGVLEWRPRSTWLDPYLPLAQALRDQGVARIYSPDYALPQQVAAALDLHLFYGVDPFQLRGVVAAIGQGSGIPEAALGDYSVVQPPLTGITGDDLALANRAYTPDTDVLRAWGVSHIIAAYPLDALRSAAEPEIVSIDSRPIYIYPLDEPAPADQFDARTSWLPGAPQFPDALEVERRDTLTLAAYAVSAAAWLGACTTFLIVRRRHAHAT